MWRWSTLLWYLVYGFFAIAEESSVFLTRYSTTTLSYFMSNRVRTRRRVLQHMPQAQPRKDEPAVQLHDEADLILFRTDALHRFITNQEYLENVTSKHIHSSKIVPPAMFPAYKPVQERSSGEKTASSDDLAEVLNSMKPDQMYFGDIQLMRTRETMLRAQNELKEEDHTGLFEPDSEYNLQREISEKLASAQAGLHDAQSLKDLEQDLDQALNQYKEKFHKGYRAVQRVTRRSIPVSELTDIKITQAPENYNPRLINSLINFKNGSDGFDGIEFPNGSGDMGLGNGLGANGPNPNVVNASQLTAQNGGGYETADLPFMQFADKEAAVATNNDFSMAMLPETNSNRNGEHKGAPSGGNDGMEDIDQLLTAGDNDVVPDDMDDLINFDQEDGDLMDGGGFEEDFLSQIDHGMN